MKIKTALIMGVVTTAIQLIAVFGVDVSTDQQAAVTAFANAFLVLVAGYLDPSVPVGRTE